MKSDDKTLVILTPAFPENESATNWIPFQQLMVKALKKNFPSLNIVVLSFIYPGRTSVYTWHGIQVISFNGMHQRKFRRIFFWRAIWKELNNIRRQHTIIGIFSIWCGECAFIGKWFGKKHLIKHHTWVCGQDALRKNKWVRFIRPRENQLAAMSPFLVSEFYKNHGVKPQHIIPNAIDPGSFLHTYSTGKDIDILGVGSLVPLKRYEVFAKVAGSVQDSLHTLKAFLCGEGEDRQKIEALIKKLKLGNSLELLGEKMHEEVLQLMLRAKVFLHTSRFEGLSGVCLEALYAGAHVISFTYPLDHPVAHWHVVSDEEEMAAKALAILQNPDMEYKPVLLYSMDDSAKAVMKLFGY